MESLTLPSFNRILLVTDFSRFSESAVPFARLLAEHYHAHLSVAHVVRPETEEGSAGPSSAAETQAAADSQREAAEAQMRVFLAEHSLEDAPSYIGRGSVTDVLAGVIQEQNIDLVVLGTHGRSGVGKLMMGSIAQRIFNVVTCPVLTVSPRARKTWGAGGKLGKILYATDFSDDAMKAFPYALSLAKVSDAELLLLHVPKGSPKEALTEDNVQRDHQALFQLVPAAARNWLKFDTLVIPGNAAENIVKAASEHNADFVVIGAHRVEEGPLYSINVPLSTAYQIVAHAHCPVLRVRS
jgi:nucleotide-binding universal stress UspA family protein